MSDFHSLATSLGTKRGVRPYWNRYNRGKEKSLKCPFHKYCFGKTWGSTPTHHKRDLYAGHCAFCIDEEGYVRASIRGYAEASGLSVRWNSFRGYCEYFRREAHDTATKRVAQKRRSDPMDLKFAKSQGFDTSEYLDVDYDAYHKKFFMENYRHVVSRAKEDGAFQLMKHRWKKLREVNTDA